MNTAFADAPFRWLPILADADDGSWKILAVFMAGMALIVAAAAYARRNRGG